MVKILFKEARKYGLTTRSIFVLMMLSFITIFTELFGIGVFIPIFQFIRVEGDIQSLVASSDLWSYAISGFNYIGLDLSISVLLVFAMLMFLLRQIFTYIRLVYFNKITQSLIRSLRNNIFQKYLKADVLFHDIHPVGDLVNLITVETNKAIARVMAPIELTVQVLVMSFYVATLMIISWEMTIIFIIIILLTSRIPSKWIKSSNVIGKKLVKANSIMSSFLVERLKSPRLVRLSGTYNAEKSEFYNLTKEQYNYQMISTVLQSKTEVVLEPVVIALSLLFIYFSYTFYSLQLEVIGVYLLVSMRLLPISKGIVMLFQKIQRLQGSLEAVGSSINQMSLEEEVDTGKLILHDFELLKFDNVTYKYTASNTLALSNISLSINKGEFIAIVGPSGGGKSTLIDLISRIRIPTSGVIEVNNTPIDDYTLESLREKISYLPQFPQIFTGQVKEHIKYGRPNASDAEVIKSAKLSGIHEHINKLEDGYSALLNEDAKNFSGGQKQRLDLARMMIKGAPILIFDEPTSSLDAVSENKFNRTLHKINEKNNVTTVIVSHRLSTIKNADKIIILNDGVVQDIGQHKELLSNNAWYASACKRQND